MTAVALAVPLEIEERLAGSSTRYGHRVVAACSGADELAGRLGSAAVEVAIVSAGEQYLSRRLVDVCDAEGIRLIVIATTPDERRAAHRLGMLDLVDDRIDWTVLEDGPAAAVSDRGSGSHRREPAVEPPSDAPGATDAGAGPELVPEPASESDPGREQHRGCVIVVWGTHGAPGRTTLAIAVAAELAATGAAVVLADADSHAASVAPALGLLDEAPGFAAACRIASSGPGSLAAEEFERIAARHPSSHGPFHVLTGLGRPSRWPELTAERVSRVMEAARDWADYIVVDVAAPIERDDELLSDLAAPGRNAATIAALHSADRILLVGRADPIGVSRLLRSHAELLETVDAPDVAVVVNRVRASAIGLDPGSQLTQTLQRFGGVTAPWLIPEDSASVDTALLRGSTLVEAAPRSPARAAVRELVEQLLVPSRAVDRAAPRRPWSPRWGRSGGRAVAGRRLA